jgi:hypothetical protein
MVGLLHRSKATTGSRPVKITLGEMRETGVRDPQKRPRADDHGRSPLVSHRLA